MSDPTLLRLTQLNPQNLGNPPYNLDVIGFNNSWWENTFRAPTEYFSFRLGKKEVARAMILYQIIDARALARKRFLFCLDCIQIHT